MTGGRASTSLKKDWQTPPKIIASVEAVFGGAIDLQHRRADSRLRLRRQEAPERPPGRLDHGGRLTAGLRHFGDLR